MCLLPHRPEGHMLDNPLWPCDHVGSDGRRISTILVCLKRSRVQDVMDAAPYCCVVSVARPWQVQTSLAAHILPEKSARLVL